MFKTFSSSTNALNIELNKSGNNNPIQLPPIIIPPTISPTTLGALISSNNFPNTNENSNNKNNAKKVTPISPEVKVTKSYHQPFLN